MKTLITQGLLVNLNLLARKKSYITKCILVLISCQIFLVGRSLGKSQDFAASLSTNPSSFSFGSVCVGVASYDSFTISYSGLSSRSSISISSNLTNGLVQFSTSFASGATYSNSLSVATNGSRVLAYNKIYVKFTPAAAQAYSGNISISGAGLSSAVRLSVSGTGAGQSAAGTISGTTTVCSGSGTTLTLSGYTGSIQWQSSPNGTNWSNIASATSASLATGNLTSKTYYRAVVTSSPCSAANTATTQVTVNPPASINTQPPTPVTTTAGSTPPGLSITANGPGTLSFQWYSNSSASTSGGTAISGATNANFAPPVTTVGTTYYYVVVSSTCGNATSNISTVTVNPFVSTTSDYFRSTGNGDWSQAASWQGSHDSLNWYTPTDLPASAASGIIIQNGHKITINAAASVSNLIINGELALNSTLTLVHQSSGQDLIVNSGGTLVISGENKIIDGNGNSSFTLGSGATLKIGSANGISASGTNGNIQTTSRTFSAGANYMYNGSVEQVTGNGLPSSLTGNLAINNAAGVTLSRATSLSGALSLTSGVLNTTAANLLKLDNGSITLQKSITDHTNSSFVNGPLQWTGTGSFIFPVGKAGNGNGTGYAPIGITTSSSQPFVAEYMRASASGLGPVNPAGASLAQVSGCDYWRLDPNSGNNYPANNNQSISGTATVTLYWSPNSSCSVVSYVTDLKTLAIAHYNYSTGWENAGAATTTGDILAGSITVTGISQFSPFTLGSTSILTNPLPILLKNFTVSKMNGYNRLSWKAESTDGWGNFVAERSADGLHFTAIATLTATNTSAFSKPFTYDDQDPGWPRVYYRVKLTDAAGKSFYSNQVMVKTTGNATTALNIYPNPVVSQATLQLNSASAQQVSLLILGADGRPVARQRFQVMAGTNSVSLPVDGLSKGLYLVKLLFADGESSVTRFVRQ